jgi:hypothetical protein
MDQFFGLIIFIVTVFGSFPFFKRLFKEDNALSVLTMSFIFGLCLIIVPLLAVGLVFQQGFGVISWVVFLSSAALFFVTIFSFFKPNFRKIDVKSFFKSRHLSIINYVFITVIVFLAVKYLLFLSLKGIFDWDATDLFLTYGRKISIIDHIPLTNYDFQPYVYPPGISILNAWVHSIGGSPYDESFRLLPCVYVFVTVAFIYLIASNLHSPKLAKIAVIIYALLPLQDSVLFYSSYYADPLYYVLILATFYFLFTYIQKSGLRYCIFGGASLGLAALIKPQFLLIVPGTLFLFISLIKNRPIKIISTILLSALSTILFIFLVWGSPAFLVSSLFYVQLLAFLFISFVTILIAFCLLRNSDQKSDFKFSLTIIHVIAFYATFAIISASWYVRNLISTGTILWTTGFSDSNYQWALNYLRTLPAQAPQLSILHFILLFIILPFSTFLLGTFWLVPKIFGLSAYVKNRRNLTLLVWMLSYWLIYFLWNFYNFQSYSLNPRDMLFFAPFFSIICGIGMIGIINFSRKSFSFWFVYLIFSIGLLSLAQSMLINIYGPVDLKNTFATFFNNYGFSVDFISGSGPNSGTGLVSSSLYSISVAFVISIIILLPILLSSKIPNIKLSFFRIKIPYIKEITLFALIFVISIAPYLVLVYQFSGGNPSNFGYSQLNPLYGGLYTDVATYLNTNANDGEIVLTLNRVYGGLQYYMNKNVTVIAMNVAGNLAAMRNIIESNSTSDIRSSLQLLNVKYFLEWKQETSPFIIKIQNTTFFQVLHDPGNFSLAKSFTSWNLYEFTADQR